MWPVGACRGFPNHYLCESWVVGLREDRPMRRYALRDDQWDRIKDFLPGREGYVGGQAEDNRLFVEAVLYRYRTGCPWRDLPERFGKWKSVHQRFSRWAKTGVFERIFAMLASDRDNEYMMIVRPPCRHTVSTTSSCRGRGIHRPDRAQV